MNIYLAGYVPKSKKEADSYVDWRLVYTCEVKKVFPDANCIDPYVHDLDEGDSLGILGKDCKSIKESDLIIINGEKQLGAGTSQEMVIAKYFKKPVVVVLPKESFHRSQNRVFENYVVEDWVHPFIHSFADFIIDDISQMRDVKERLSEAKIKDISIIDKAVDYSEGLNNKVIGLAEVEKN